MKAVMGRLGPWVVVLAIGVAFIFVMLVIDLFRLPFGDVMTLVGVGLVMGTLTGQNKQSWTPWRTYLAQRGLAIFMFYGLIVTVALLYMFSQDQEGVVDIATTEMLAVIILMVTGWVIGFVTGIDKDKSMSPDGEE